MDTENYNQYELALGDVEDQLPYMVEGLEGVRALIYNDECVGIAVPDTVELKSHSAIRGQRQLGHFAD